MRSRLRRSFLRVLVLLLVASGCSGSSDDSAADALDGVSESCAEAAQEIVDRFDGFLAPYADLSPNEFLEQPELDGLEQFQNDVADVVVRVAQNPNDDCTEADLEDAVSVALQEYSGESLLQQYLVGAVRTGVQVERRDIVVTPDDDLLTLLPLLGPGSSVTFTEGVFELDATLLVQTDLVLVGAGREATSLRSSAEAAAIAVLGQGNLAMSEMSVQHTGDLPASVLVAFDTALTLDGVGLSGAVADDDGAGGSGLVLTGAADASTAPTGAEAEVTIANSDIRDNAAAGIAVTATIAPAIFGSSIADNAQCGICYFDTAAGLARDNTLQGNGVGLQASGESGPEISGNRFVDNEVAGMLLEDATSAAVLANEFEGEGVVGIDVQGDTTAEIRANTFGPHAVALSLRERSTATASDNVFSGGDVAILVGGSADPTVMRNTIDGSVVSSFLHAETSTGTFAENVITDTQGAAVVVEGSAAPTHRSNTLTGGLVGFVFRESSTGLVVGNDLEGLDVGLESGDSSAPTIENNTFEAIGEAGVIFSGDSTARFTGNAMTNPAAIGIQAGGASEPTIEDNTVDGGDTAVLITEQSRPQVIENMLSNQNFGIGVSGDAEPTIEDNEIRNAAAGAISFEGTSTGTVSGNRVIDAGVVGFRIAGSASPTFEANVLFAAVELPPGAEADDDAGDGDGDGDASDGDASDGDVDANNADDAGDDEQGASGAGILYAEEAAGRAEANEVFGFVIGIQVSDDAAPVLVENTVDGAGVGGVGILYGANGAGRAERNRSINQQLGFQLGGAAAPELIGNVVADAAAAAFLLQGDSTASLVENECPPAVPGIVILEAADPQLADNRCEVSRG